MGRKTNKNRRQSQAQTAREKAAAARSQQRRSDQRRRATVILSSVVAVAVVAAVIAVVALNQHGSNGPATKASDTVVTNVTSVPASVTDAIGAGDSFAQTVPASIDGTRLDANGKPSILFIGGEFCPFCAAQRWALVEALSRFGTFSGLEQITSSEDHISTFTFAHAKFASKYVNFDPKEEEDQNQKPFQKLTDVEKAQWNKYLAPNTTSPGFPFVDYNGQYVSEAPLLDARVLFGKSWAQIAESLKDPSSPVARAVDGAANVITATICRLTGNQPASACPASVTALSAHFPAYPAQ
jgi:Domain of unknown function (DUF929)